MYKKIILFLIFMFSFVSCGQSEKNLEFHEDFDKLQVFYDTAIYKVIDVEFDSKIDSFNSYLSNKTYYVTDDGSYFHISSFFTNPNYINSPYYAKEDNEYFEYSLNSQTNLVEKTPYELVDLDKIVLSGLPTLDNYEKYLEKTHESYSTITYIANIEYSKFTKQDKKEIETSLSEIEGLKDYEVTIHSVTVRYDIMATSLKFTFSMDASFRYIGTNKNITVIEFQDTMKLTLNYKNSYFDKHSYDGYLFEDDAFVCNSINKVSSTTDLNSTLYLFPNSNYYLFNLKKGYYKVASSKSVNDYNRDLKVKLFDKNKNEISTLVDDFLLNDAFVASTFFVKEDGDYYICINNSGNGYYAKLYQLEYDDFIDNENYDFSNVSSTFLNDYDVDKYVLNCDSLTLYKIESNTDCNIYLYYNGSKYSIAPNGPLYILIDEGNYDIYLKISNPYNYPYPISYSLTIDKMVIENPTYGENKIDYNSLDVISEDFSNNIYFYEGFSQKYFLFESKEEGFYKYESQYINEFINENIYLSIYPAIPENGDSIIIEEGYFYLKANTKYIFVIQSYNTAIKAKISYAGNLYKDVQVELGTVNDTYPFFEGVVENKRDHINEIVRYHFTLSEETTIATYDYFYIFDSKGNQLEYIDNYKMVYPFNSYVYYITLQPGDYYFEVPFYCNHLSEFKIYRSYVEGL